MQCFTNKAASVIIQEMELYREYRWLSGDKGWRLCVESGRCTEYRSECKDKLNPNTQKITIDELGNIYLNDHLFTRIGVVDFDDYNYISKYGENLYDLVDGVTDHSF